jgi:hypothetical protein
MPWPLGRTESPIWTSASIYWRSAAAFQGWLSASAHRDLDLAVDAADLGRCLGLLGGLGYVAETDWLPSRMELRAPGDRWVDVHPVAFGEDGSGRQADWTAGSSSTRRTPSTGGVSPGASSGACRHVSSAASAAATSTGPKTSTTLPSSTPSPNSDRPTGAAAHDSRRGGVRRILPPSVTALAAARAPGAARGCPWCTGSGGSAAPRKFLTGPW